MKGNKFRVSGLIFSMLFWNLLALPVSPAVAEGSGSGQAPPGVLADNSPASFMVVGPSSEGVIIDVRNGALGKVLQSIAEQSSIEFKFSDEISNLRVTLEVRGKDWDSAVRELIKNYGTVLAEDDRGHVKKVFILRASDEDSPKNMTGRSARANKNPRAIGEITHSEDQLRVIGRGPYRAPLAMKLFEDPQYKEFLVQNGIQTAEDLQDREKAKHVRWVARRHLKELMKRNRMKKQAP